jgi:hypothetical protein
MFIKKLISPQVVTIETDKSDLPSYWSNPNKIGAGSACIGSAAGGAGGSTGGSSNNNNNNNNQLGYLLIELGPYLLLEDGGKIYL